MTSLNMEKRPRILFVSSMWPLPMLSGAHQRVLNMLRLLNRIGDITLVIVESRAGDKENVRLVRSEFDVRRVMPTMRIVPDGPIERIQHRIRHDFDPGYLKTSSRAISEHDRKALIELVEEHDLVWVDSILTPNVCRIYKWPHSVLDTVDLPSGSYRSLAKSANGPVQRLSNLRRSWIWRKRERLLGERFDVLIVCSENDRIYLGSHPRIHVIPNGYCAQPVRRQPHSKAPRIGFIGGFHWPPNKDGMEWFARDVWPVIKREVPQAQLRLVGPESQCYGAKLGPDITGLGWLEDPSDEIATWSAMIVPIRFGSGTRVKVAEGFARKCPMVSTGIGAFGYDVRDGEEILLADDAMGFATACIRLMRDPELGSQISELAYKRFLKEWTWDSSEGKVRSVVEECLARSGYRKRDEIAGTEVASKSCV